jgi:uncharacterized protein YuzE
MVVYYDTKDDVATIALRGGIGPDETKRYVSVLNDTVYLYLNAAGQLIAVELRDPDMLHPDLAKDAIQMRPIREGDL